MNDRMSEYKEQREYFEDYIYLMKHSLILSIYHSLIEST